MDKKKIFNEVKDFTKNFSYGYNVVIDATLLVAGIKLRNRKLIIGAAVATIGTAACIYDSSVKPLVDGIKEEIEFRKNN